MIYSISFETILARLRRKIGTPQGKHGCQMWQGPIWDKNRPVQYGKCRNPFKRENKEYPSFLKAHKLLYMAVNQITDCKEVGPGEFSHICHQPLCMNINHIVLEVHDINIARRNCHQRGQCTHQHDFPPCLL